MSDELKKVPETPVVEEAETPSPEAMYCRAFDSNRNVIGCTAKSSESSCQAYAQGKNATYYSYTRNSC